MFFCRLHRFHQSLSNCCNKCSGFIAPCTFRSMTGSHFCRKHISSSTRANSLLSALKFFRNVISTDHLRLHLVALFYILASSRHRNHDMFKIMCYSSYFDKFSLNVLMSQSACQTIVIALSLLDAPSDKYRLRRHSTLKNKQSGVSFPSHNFQGSFHRLFYTPRDRTGIRNRQQDYLWPLMV